MEETIRIGIKAINNDSPYNENFDTYFEIFFENVVTAICMQSTIPMPNSIEPMSIEVYADETVDFEIEEVVDTGTT